MTSTIARILVLVLAAACVRTTSGPTPTASTPAFMIGAFQDDYGSRHVINDSLWVQGRSRYRITRWNAGARYLIAQNDSANVHAPGKWSRIDWVELTGMPD